MIGNSLPARLLFRLRHLPIAAWIRTGWLRLCGARIGPRTWVARASVTWPHQLKLGADCQLEADIFFKFDGIWCPGPSIIIGDRVFLGRGCEFNIKQRITIGQGSAIASGCKFIDHDHGISGLRLDETPGQEAAITLGDYVWLGCNVVVLKGVTIGSSAVVGAGAVVTKNIPGGEIWAGVPARLVGKRKP